MFLFVFCLFSINFVNLIDQYTLKIKNNDLKKAMGQDCLTGLAGCKWFGSFVLSELLLPYSPACPLRSAIAGLLVIQPTKISAGKSICLSCPVFVE